MNRRYPAIMVAFVALVSTSAAMAEEISSWSSTSIEWSSGSAPVVTHSEGTSAGLLAPVQAAVAQPISLLSEPSHETSMAAAPSQASTDSSWAGWDDAGTAEFEAYFHRVFGQMSTDMRRWPIEWNWSGSAAVTESAPMHIASYVNGLQEVPAVSTNGYGLIRATIHDHELHYSLDVDALSSGITGAHFHRGGFGVAGPVLQHITFTGSHAEGIWQMNDQDLQDLLAGRIYVNVHTAMYPNGEIRGQL